MLPARARDVAHHCDQSLSDTASVPTNTIAPGTSTSSGGFGVPGVTCDPECFAVGLPLAVVT